MSQGDNCNDMLCIAISKEAVPISPIVSVAPLLFPTPASSAYLPQSAPRGTIDSPLLSTRSPTQDLNLAPLLPLPAAPRPRASAVLSVRRLSLRPVLHRCPKPFSKGGRSTRGRTDTLLLFPSFSPTRPSLRHTLSSSQTAPPHGFSAISEDISIMDMHNIEVSCAAESEMRSLPSDSQRLYR
jgi:hypothetical protein